MNFVILCKTLGLPNQALVDAIGSLGCLDEIFSAHADDLATWFSPKECSLILNWQSSASIREKYSTLEHALANAGAQTLALGSKDYPTLLKEISAPPAVLFVKGSISTLSLPQIAIVGSRNATAQGRQIAREFAAQLAASGFSISSGLALGIDAAAHQGAVETLGKTCAVMGTGIDQIYPARNRLLARNIVEAGGALVSEFLPGSPPRAWHFPHRNRIVTGLSMAVLVIEAGERSGSLISARLAAEQGREVFAIPGSLKSPVSAGCHRLIRDGATLVTEAGQVVEQLGPILGFQIASSNSGDAAEQQASPSTDDEHWLLKQMGFDPVNVDELCGLLDCSGSEIITALAELELEGKVTQTPYGYQRCV